jgi:sec-independent protein translocase protein TatB
VNDALGQSSTGDTPTYEPYNWDSTPAPAAYTPAKKNWRIKRSAVPQWYKKSENVRRHVQSGAARVARFRPARPTRSP